MTHWVTWGPVPHLTLVPSSVRERRSYCQVRLEHGTVLPFAVSSCCKCQMLLEKAQAVCNRSLGSNVPWRTLGQLMISISPCVNWCHLGCRIKLVTVRKRLFSAPTFILTRCLSHSLKAPLEKGRVLLGTATAVSGPCLAFPKAKCNLAAPRCYFNTVYVNSGLWF